MGVLNVHNHSIHYRGVTADKWTWTD